MLAETMFAEYEADLRSRKVSATALREYRIVTERFMAFLRTQGLDADEVRRPHVQAFFAGSGWSPSTQHARLTWLRSPYLYAVEELGALERNPVQRVRLERVPRRDIRTIPIEVLRRARDEAHGDRQAATFALFAYTGMRLSEVRGLTWEGVSFTDGSLSFVGKGGAHRTIPMHPAVERELRKLGAYAGGAPYVIPGHAGGEMGRVAMHYRVKRLLPEPYSAHDFRHTVATSLEHNGAREAAIFSILGWSPDGSLRLRHYTRMPLPVLARELLKLYADDPL